MKKILILMLVVYGYTAQAQHCSDVINTVTTDWRSAQSNNTWDWTTLYFQPYIYPVGSTTPTQMTVLSPFRIESGNSVQWNSNLAPFYDAFAFYGFQGIDFHPEEGWELLAKDFGNATIGVNNPFFALYNRYTGHVRAFFLIMRNPGETMNGAYVRLKFEGTKSALLSHVFPIAQPVEEFNNTAEFYTPNYYSNEDRFWIYADFPMAYDPCTCTNSSKIKFEFELIKNQTIKLKGKSTGEITEILKPSSNTNNNLNFRSSLKKFENALDNGFKTYKTWAGFDTEVNKILNLKDAAKVNFFSPYGVVIGLYDIFFGGGTKTTQRPPMNFEIEQTYTFEGEIANSGTYGTPAFLNPGATNQSNALVPIYNNAMGVISITKMPVLEITNYFPEQYSISNVYTWGYARLKPIQQYKVKEELQYAVNPASNLALEDLQVAIIMDYGSANFNYLEKYGMRASIPDGGTDVLGGPVQLGIPDQALSFKNRLEKNGFYIDSWPLTIPASPNPWVRIRTKYMSVHHFQQNSFLVETDNYNLRKFYCKIVAKLRVKDKPNLAPVDIILTYPIRTINSTAPLNASGYHGTFTWDYHIPTRVFYVNDLKSTAVSNQPAYPLPFLQNIPETGGAYPWTNNPIQSDIKVWQYIQIYGVGVNVPFNTTRSFVAGNYIDLGYYFGSDDTDETPLLLAPNGNSSAIMLDINSPFASKNLVPQQTDFSFCTQNVYKSRIVSFTDEVEGKAEDSDKLEDVLSKNQVSVFPNPTSSLVTFAYELAEAGQVSLLIQNTLGENVAVLVQDQAREAGKYETIFDTATLPAGIYFYTLSTGSFKETKRLVVLK